MTENEISKVVLDVAFEIHKTLGPGLLESVYEIIMEYELVHTHKLKVSRQREIPGNLERNETRARISL